MKKITYLLGAGASANALPIVEDISKFIHLLTENLSDYNYGVTDLDYFEKIPVNKLDIKNDLINSLEKISSEIREGVSFDDYACTLIEDIELYNRITTAFCVYFSYLEKSGYFDGRYVKLLNQILNKHGKIKENVKILNWNYDNQIQIAYMNRPTTTKEFSISNESIGIVNKYSIINFAFGSVYKLNGTINYNCENSRLISIPFVKKKFKRNETEMSNRFKLADEIVENYGKCIHGNYYNQLSFAYNRDGNTLPNAKDDTIQTEILIIIGYSFPDYNAKVDKEIIENMINSNLRKIYIQDPNPENIKSNLLKNLDVTENFLNQIGIKFTLDSNCDKFHTPMELIQ